MNVVNLFNERQFLTELAVISAQYKQLQEHTEVQSPQEHTFMQSANVLKFMSQTFQEVS
jgi:hypothetical protein